MVSECIGTANAKDYIPCTKQTTCLLEDYQISTGYSVHARGRFSCPHHSTQPCTPTGY